MLSKNIESGTVSIQLNGKEYDIAELGAGKLYQNEVGTNPKDLSQRNQYLNISRITCIKFKRNIFEKIKDEIGYDTNTALSLIYQKGKITLKTKHETITCKKVSIDLKNQDPTKDSEIKNIELRWTEEIPTKKG